MQNEKQNPYFRRRGVSPRCHRRTLYTSSALDESNLYAEDLRLAFTQSRHPSGALIPTAATNDLPAGGTAVPTSPLRDWR